jgi:uncharacterized ferredoxin-like protein
MSIIYESDIIKTSIIDVAQKMIVAARTAPKGKGQNNIETAIVHGDDLFLIADKMKEIAIEGGASFFERDANNILQSSALVLIGTRIKSLGLPICGLCGMGNCANKNKHLEIPCAFNTGDLGIAIGSAVSIAMNKRVDNRIMYTVGIAVKELKIFNDDVKIIYGIPLSATSKNPFFDRVVKK